jgi:hypothetical protein
MLKKRVIILLGYLFSAAVVAYVFGGFGDGSFVPLAVLVSWPGFFSRLFNHMLRVKETGLPLEALFIQLAAFVLYYYGLLTLASKLKANRLNRYLLVPRIVHFAGGLALMLVLDKQDVIPPFLLYRKSADFKDFWFLASYVVIIVLSLLWFSVDWRLAKGPQEPPEDNNSESR